MNEGEAAPLLHHNNDNNKSEYEREYEEELRANKGGIWRKKPLLPRLFPVNGKGLLTPPNAASSFPKNEIHNTRYNILTFLPICLYEQFKSFINLYYLILSLSQFIPALRVGPILTYAAPLAFVVALSLSMEAYLDIKRYLRDKQANSEEYMRLTPTGFQPIPSSLIQVGHFIRVDVNRRIPADMLLLRTTSESGASYIRTDQLDGETDWKLRKAVHYTQQLPSDSDLFHLPNALLYAEKPKKDIYDFIGNFIYSLPNHSKQIEPLSLENVMWSSTVLASDTIIGLVLYTGSDTRSVLNTKSPSTKRGIIETELNILTVGLCAFAFVIAFVLLGLGGFKGLWWLDYFLFLVLVSAVIPISMKVNMDLAKFVYAWFVVTDEEMPGCLVRNTNIAEDLGRISYLFSDKTGTLTQNEMVFKKLHMGQVNYSSETLNEIASALHDAASLLSPSPPLSNIDISPIMMEERRGEKAMMMMREKGSKVRMGQRLEMKVWEVITAIALCHNVTPVLDDSSSPSPSSHLPRRHRHLLHDKGDDDDDDDDGYGEISMEAHPLPIGEEEEEERRKITYQASSPDEVSLVKFTESVGITLYRRSFTSITLLTPAGEEHYDILETFPFSSERKRMGIIVRQKRTGEIRFLMKGADVIMAKIVKPSDWLEEECDNLAREGLRTLIFGQKALTEEQWEQFRDRLHEAQSSMKDRDLQVAQAISSLEADLDLLCLTGVEDKLQEKVKNTLETLRNGGINIWMLTGDKRETATCIGISSKLISKSHSIFQFDLAGDAGMAEQRLGEFRAANNNDTALVIDGASLQILLDRHSYPFYSATKNAPSVVCCRCSPTQKAEVVELIKRYSGKQVAAIGDGGNDVSMIQSANIGVGIVGKEGKQASLAADYSILTFKDISSLFLWHGRNAYHNSAMLSQFIIYRGLIATFVQVVFSAIFYMSPVVVGYTGALAFGYSSWYTMMPVFALTLDADISKDHAHLYPELYSDLKKGRALSPKTFFLFLLIALYQALSIQLLPLLLGQFNYVDLISLTFTACVFTTLLMVAMVVSQWNTLLLLSFTSTIAIYPIFMILLPAYYHIEYISTMEYWLLLGMLVLVACVPVKFIQFLVSRLAPTSSSKLKEYF